MYMRSMVELLEENSLDDADTKSSIDIWMKWLGNIEISEISRLVNTCC